jgi:hypothetical protein
MKGLVCSERERLKFHLLDVNQCLVDINRAFKPGLAIVEGLIGLEGIGPSSPGTPIDLGLLIGGQDAVAVDAVCTRIMRMEPADIRHIKLAAEANLGTMNFDEIEIQGEKLERVIPEYFEKPPSTIEEISPYQKIRIVNGNPCSNCIVGLASYLHAWVPKELATHTKSELRILLGPRARMRRKGNEIALGNCLKRYKGKIPYISGCPPASDAYGGIIEDALRGKFLVYEDNIDSTLERITPNPYQ